MITAIVLVRAERATIPQVAAKLANMKFVSEVYSVTGDWDVVVMLRLPNFEDLDDAVAGELRQIPGIERTSTMLAFRSYGSDLLDKGFSIGSEP